MITLNKYTGIALALGLAASLSAQDVIHKAAAQDRAIVVRNATIHTVSGPTIENGTIWFSDGIIRGVHAADEQVQLPDGALIIEADGMHVYPGLVTPVSAIGLSEIGSVAVSVDTNERAGISPEARAATAVNPDSAHFPVARTNGILVAGVFPQGGPIAGRASILQLDGWTWSDMTLKPDAGLVISWPAARGGGRGRRGGRGRGGRGGGGGSTDDQRKLINDTFAEARAWRDARAIDPSIKTDLRWEAMIPALNGEVPTFISANGLEQIQSAVSWAVDNNLKAVIVGGRDADLCADLLVRHNIPVIVNGTHSLPRRRDMAYSDAFELPRKLYEAGVTWCFSSGGGVGGSANERNLPYQAATAVAYGLPHEEALKAVTQYSAEIMGIGDRVGSLEAGMDATIIITNGDPLELPTDVLQAYITGKRIDLANKQTLLADKYREKYRQLGLIPTAAADATIRRDR